MIDRERVLVVGAGLTGAALAWLALRRGARVVVVTDERPASLATALTPGIVHGFGPPGEGLGWPAASPAEARAWRRRSEKGFERLAEALFAASRPVGLNATRHALDLGVGVERDTAERLVGAWASAGFPVELDDGRDGSVSLLRADDALLCRRRLTFELLRHVREGGARLLIGRRFALERADARSNAAFTATLGEERVEVDRVFWATGREGGFAERPALPRARRRRLMLHQRVRAGARPLTSVFEAERGDVLLAPDPCEGGGLVLIRLADERPGFGIRWPELPRAWLPFLGPTYRQQLTETWVEPPSLPDVRESAFLPLVGFAGWPVAPLLGACEELVLRSRA